MIRVATRDDLEPLLRICQKSFDTSWSKASFESEFSKDYSKVFTYCKGSDPIGYIVVWMIQDEGEIVSLAVDTGWRNKGIASMLIQHVLLNYPKIVKWHLEVDPRNIAAYSLYRKHYFKKVRVIKNYYGQGNDGEQMVFEVVGESDVKR